MSRFLRGSYGYLKIRYKYAVTTDEKKFSIAVC